MKKKNKQSNVLQVVDSKTIIAQMEQKMPVWVKEMNNKEDMANAMYATGQEMLLVILDTLERYHGFKESDLKKFTKEIEDVLTGAKEFEKHGLSILSPHSVGVVGEKIQQIGITGLLTEIAQTRLLKEKMARAGMEYPVTLGATSFIKKLNQKK